MAGLLVQRHFQHVGAGFEGRGVAVEAGDQPLALVADDVLETLDAGIDDVGDLVDAPGRLHDSVSAPAPGQRLPGPVGAFVEVAADLNQRGVEPALERIDIDGDALVELFGQQAEDRLRVLGSAARMSPTICALRPLERADIG